jgi:hypothetical protein
MEKATAKVTVEFPSDEARALAQLVKRLGYDDAERLSSPYDSGEEREAMLSDIDKLSTRWQKPGSRRSRSGNIVDLNGEILLAKASSVVKAG